MIMKLSVEGYVPFSRNGRDGKFVEKPRMAAKRLKWPNA
jgi:hypothetical protein